RRVITEDRATATRRRRAMARHRRVMVRQDRAHRYRRRHIKRCRVETMIGPPGLPKPWRRSIAPAPRPARWRRAALTWGVCLYLAGAIAHFGHHMAFDLPDGSDASVTEALTVAPVILAW